MRLLVTKRQLDGTEERLMGAVRGAGDLHWGEGKHTRGEAREGKGRQCKVGPIQWSLTVSSAHSRDRIPRRGTLAECIDSCLSAGLAICAVASGRAEIPTARQGIALRVMRESTPLTSPLIGCFIARHSRPEVGHWSLSTTNYSSVQFKG